MSDNVLHSFRLLPWRTLRGQEGLEKYHYSAGRIHINPFLFVTTEESLIQTQIFASKSVVTVSFSTEAQGRGNHTDLW